MIGGKKKTMWSIVTIGVVVCGVLVGYRAYTNAAVEHQQEDHFQTLMSTTNYQGRPAPDFTLTDQNGQKVTLSSLHGKVVVLQFMDPVCTDICPIISQEVMDANKDLSDKSANVVYVAVNVNQYHESTADVLQFSQAHQLNTLPNWHFVTGSTEQLKKIWHDYGIEVVPNPSGDVVHSSYMFWIDKDGNQQYVANPDNSTSKISDWGQGISFYAKKLM